MAFPVVADTNTSRTDSAGTSHTVSLPPNISVGDLLLVFFATDGDNTVTNWGGFTEIFSESNGAAASLHVGYKIAVGSDTLTITTSSSEESSHASYRITGHSTSQAPEASVGDFGNNDINPNPDSLTPTGGAKDYLWIAVEGNDHLDTTASWPANFTLYNLEDSNGDAGGCNIGVGARELNASVLDPGVFTLDAAEQWVACTVAVHPATAGDVTGTARADAVSRADAAGGKIVKGSGTAHARTRSNALGGLSIKGSATANAVSSSISAGEKDVWGAVKAYAQAASIAAGMLALGGAAQADAVSTSTISGIGEFAGNARGDGVSSSIASGGVDRAGTTRADGISTATSVGSRDRRGVSQADSVSTAQAIGSTSTEVLGTARADGVSTAQAIGNTAANEVQGSARADSVSSVITAGGVILVGVSRADSVSSSISVGTVSGATPEARTIKIYRDNRAIEIHADYRIIKVYKR